MIVLNNNSCKKGHHKLSRLKININCIFVKFFEKFKNKYFLFLFETSAYNCVQMVNLRTNRKERMGGFTWRLSDCEESSGGY